METVIAIFLLVTGPTTLEYKSSISVTLDECMEQAEVINSDPDLPYILVCAPADKGEPV